MHLIIAEKNIAARRIAEILAGKEKVQAKKDGAANLYIFGDTRVIGLRGHVVEVDFEPGYDNWRSTTHPPRTLIDAGIIKRPTEKKIVAILQKIARKAESVTIATDYDTEGELIGKEAYELVRAVNRDVAIDRARFSAITAEEIKKAFSETNPLDFHLAAAGETRQIVDLVWGASLTRFISIAAKRGGGNILSVGRVQSPTLAMIVEREREIEAFVPETYWMVRLLTERDDSPFEARHTHGRFKEKKEAEAAVQASVPPLTVTDVIEGEKNDRAPSPLDTTTLIVAAGRLGYSAANAMRVAEDLYMNGYISYPRTDNTVYPKSLNLRGIVTDLSRGVFAEDGRWVTANMRQNPTRGKKETTDHPPIHPVSYGSPDQIGEGAWKLYEFIVRRYFATLSPDAKWKTQKVNLLAGSEHYTTTGSRLHVPGYRSVYPYSDAKELVLPKLAEGMVLPINAVHLDEKETKPPARYTQSRLIQKMEELGLGTKSTRHEVIQKLIARKYIEGNPLRPTLVGRAVTDTLSEYADTITKPGMTRSLEDHMNQIKVNTKGKTEVIEESREMLNRVFDQLEENEELIGRDIMEMTVEESMIGPCPSCGHQLRIRRMGSSQFIGCMHYPDCSFNISLPPGTWGGAVRTKDLCPEHNLHHIRLVRKGARPWDLGCPLCSHIESNREALAMIPDCTGDRIKKLHANHLYAITDITNLQAEELARILGISETAAESLRRGAEEVIERLRRRTGMKKFIRSHIAPRRGRSPAKVAKTLYEAGVEDITALGGADPNLLKQAGISDDEAATLLQAAKKESDTRILREIGIPAVSLKKYQAAGISAPEDFMRIHPAGIALASGVTIETVIKHVSLVCDYYQQPAPEKISKAAFEKGQKELVEIPGIGDSTLRKLADAGIYNKKTLLAAEGDLFGLSGDVVSKLQKEAA
ncbi:MAG: DNA topoisomerase I [Methanocalculus sp. MSAO_Arc1]|uniref:DNA topoisomerase I n=1 Tax=Methanocalculus TaxID=71151 RepID=UPI000FEF8BA1|nr:DNA topoisomerase I [Methanocalculus sp. MSAO_Arc1]RQD81225.1 MAG: DNA topoisomerase I [Methanocalculus sp. MSAO_Arc1]